MGNACMVYSSSPKKGLTNRSALLFDLHLFTTPPSTVPVTMKSSPHQQDIYTDKEYNNKYGSHFGDTRQRGPL